MKFVTPSQYTKSNQAHYIINTTAVNDFIKMHPKLSVNDRVLDFGCGTGETTLAIAQGNLGDLGQPGEVGPFSGKQIIISCKFRLLEWTYQRI